MIILGVNGWYDRGHDASACIIKDGVLIAAVEEERFSRQKHSYDTMPHSSVAWCLNYCGINVDNIDVVAVGWDIPLLYAEHKRELPFRNKEGYLDILLPREYFGIRHRNIPVCFVNHHRAHAANSFYLSGFDESLVLVIDGQGEDSATTIWRCTKGELNKIISFPVLLSLGYFFEAVSSFIGFSTTHAGKTMGLAAYGEAPDRELFVLNDDGYDIKKAINLTSDGSELDEQSQLFKYWGERLTEIFGEPNRSFYRFSRRQGIFYPDVKITSREQSVAALAQRELERVVLHLVKTYTKQYNLKNLCLAGGVALNCSCNGKILLSGLVDNLFIQPAPHDTGVAIGAALEVANQYNDLNCQRMVRADLGPTYDDGEIISILKEMGIRFSVEKDIADTAAHLISSGKIIGWFQGKCEIGPRALGNRSIIANPHTVETRDRVNIIKGRESWRPLSPSVLAEKSSWLLGQDIDMPFMLLGLPVAIEKRHEVAGVVHIDGTARPQTVTKDLGRYYQMITAFESITGIPLVLNTSFNGPGEPIVCTPSHAVHCFFEHPLDALVLGNCIIRRE
ncbi:MAG: carbamoyltransferase C-terminal domain-containing protein [bacterium]|nr:carbamoyltransferase C-terminal domain-containing protein [bacterium]